MKINEVIDKAIKKQEEAKAKFENEEEGLDPAWTFDNMVIISDEKRERK